MIKDISIFTERISKQEQSEKDKTALDKPEQDKKVQNITPMEIT